ncbi:RHS repeat protein, partial [Luteimonas sp. Y-2-2-4F]
MGGLALAAATAVHAVEPQHEYRKRIESAQTLTALTDQLMGEQVSLYNGATEFVATDIDLPGNDGLPVRLSRRLRIELFPVGNGGPWNANLRGAGDWDVDVPYIAGNFASGANGGWPATRCSQSSVPYVAGFNSTEFWQGTQVHVPGEGDRAMLMLQGVQVPQPTDGVQRRWTTRERDMFACIPMRSGLDGEGFAMRTTSGLEYHFDVGVSRNVGQMSKPIAGVGTYHVSRYRQYLLASRIVDRFGNSVNFQYDGDGRPTRIEGSDGRLIQLTYTNGQLTSATAHGRTWQYQYAGAWLSRVVQPDGHAWQYAATGTLTPSYATWDGNSNATCTEQPPEIEAAYTLSITHPSGTVGAFAFANQRHYRAGVHASECQQHHASGGGVVGGTYYYTLGTPNFFDVMSLQRKTLTGTGLPTLEWAYAYGGSYQALWGSRNSPATYPCASCPTEKTATVVQPDGTVQEYRYGFLYALNEGRLLGSRTRAAGGTVLRTESTTYLAEADAGSQAFQPRYGTIINGDDPSTAAVRPVTQQVVEQDGAQFVWQAQGFDAFARPTQASKSSNLVGATARTEVNAYHDDLAGWVLGQPSKLTVNGIVASETLYDSRAQPTTLREFGRTTQTLTYHPDGTVATVADGRGHVTTLSSWKRGVPQTVRHPATPEAPNGATRSAVVNDAGWITRVTDENGFATNYQHDAMGRITRIVYPTGDSVAWHDSTFSLVRATAAAYGLPAGHWQHAEVTGQRNKVTYLDALWRPVLVHEYDAGNAAGTQRFTRQAFDQAGRVTFASYPS